VIHVFLFAEGCHEDAEQCTLNHHLQDLQTINLDMNFCDAIGISCLLKKFLMQQFYVLHEMLIGLIIHDELRLIFS
jgi:hypothetical protein